MIDLLSVAAGCSLALLSYQLGRVAYRLAPYFTPSLVSRSIKANNYVLAVGCTDGIGLRLAEELNKSGLRLIVIGRNAKKLQDLSQKFQGTIAFQMDFAQFDLQESIFSKYLLELTQKIEQSVAKEFKIVGLINSVGVAHFSKYEALTVSEMAKIHRTNINSLHFMLRASDRLAETNLIGEKPFFINISSAVAQQPLKYSTVYAATKAYLSNLIEGVSQQKKSWIFLDVKPWYVKTKMIGYPNSYECVQPEQVARGSLRVLGKRKSCAGCWKHELLDELSWLVRDRIDRSLQQKMAKLQRVQALLKNRRQK